MIATRWLTSLVVLVPGIVLGLVSCNGREGYPSIGDDFLRPVGDVGPRGSSCKSSESRECRFEIGTSNGITNCAQGIQVCEGGKWGACIVDPFKGTLAIPATGGTRTVGPALRPLALTGDDATCSDPCDPYCSVTGDVPVAPIVAPQEEVVLAGTPTATVATWDEAYVQGHGAGKFDQLFVDPTHYCTDTCPTDPSASTCQSACEMDRSCTPSGCEDNVGDVYSTSCSGLPDVTLRSPCLDEDDVLWGTVCNRGNGILKAGVNCYLTATNIDITSRPEAADYSAKNLLWTTLKDLAPGECESHDFENHGLSPLVCNPTTVSTATVQKDFSGAVTTNPVDGYSAWDVSGVGCTGCLASVTSPGTVKYATTATTSGSPSWSDTSKATGSTLGDYASVAPANPTTAGGPSSVTSGTAATAGCTSSWSNTGNTTLDDLLFASAAPGKKDSACALWGNFGMSALPIPPTGVITGLTVEAKVKGSATLSGTSISLAVVDATTGTAIAGGDTSNASKSDPGTSETTISQSFASGKLTPAQLADGAFGVKLTAAKGNTSTAWTAFANYVKATVSWLDSGTPTTSTLWLNSFGFDAASIPSGASVTAVSCETKWKSSVSTTDAVLGAQVFLDNGTTPVGTETTVSPPSMSDAPPLTFSVSGLTREDLINRNPSVRVRATRQGATDFVAYVDYAKISASYSTSAPTYGLEAGNFSIPATVPADATINSVTTSLAWNTSVASAPQSISLQAYVNGVARGTATTDSSPSTSPRTVTQALTGASMPSLADMANGAFAVRVITSQTGSGANFSTFLNLVKTTVNYTFAGVTVGQAECNYYNNVSFAHNTNGAATHNPRCTPPTTLVYVPFTTTKAMEPASCPPSTHPTWKGLYYQTSTPPDTMLKFYVRTWPATADGLCTGGVPPEFSTTAVVTIPTVDTNQTCWAYEKVGEEIICPKDLKSYLLTAYPGSPNAVHEACLELKVDGTPNTAGTATPQVTAWKAAYDCGESE